MRYTLSVVPGLGRGRKIGVPTINCRIPKNFLPEHGIYAGWVYIDDTKLPAVVHYGPRPVFDEADPSLEVHVLQPVDSSIPETIELEPAGFIRKVQTFATPQEMVARIKHDVAQAKECLGI